MALKARAERNSRLILASLAGVRSGMARIEQIAAERGELRTYTAAGQPATTGPRPSGTDSVWERGNGKRM